MEGGGDMSGYNKIPAKPTKYNGRQYRSRLEARVAAYFYIRGKFCEYEPIDLPGWSPDFLINILDINGRHFPAYVEVKPDPSMFDIMKYLSVVNLKEKALVLFTVDHYISFLENGVYVNYQEEPFWSQAANEVMFLKPEA